MATEPHNKSRARVIISGRVQGVWFRASTQELAQKMDLNGWVRNLSTGEVEAVFEGPRHKVEKALEWCREGPPGARVDYCDEIWEQPAGESRFEIRR